MNKQQLANKIWESANKMRSKIEANEYKDYILGFLFYKYLSDKEKRWLKSQEYSDEDIKKYVNEGEKEVLENIQNSLGYFIAYSDLYDTWLNMGSDFSIDNVRTALSSFDRLISKTHRKVFDKIFNTLDTGLSKLGDNTKSQTKAVSDLLQLIKDVPTDGRQGYDVLGYVYEYLIQQFASNAGKKAGEFYTPHEVSVLMSEIIANHMKDRDEIRIYDPTSGSGSLLINIGEASAKYIGDKNKIRYYAQELKQNTYNLTRMNLVMRDIIPDNIITRCGDTLEEDWPYFDESDPASTYDPLYVDAVVSNPPYSQQWYPKDKESDPRYSRFGLAPKSKADYAFLLHDLYHLKPDGIMTIVLPHGVLFRGGEEGEIRKNLIENNHIDAIIGLPANIFYGTGIPTIVMVLKQKRDNTDVLIVDASKGFIKEGKNNKLRACDIRKAVDTVVERLDIDKYSRKVSKEEIRNNDYNLNIPRYVDSSEKAESHDIYALMFGGIPKTELADLNDFWDAFPSLQDELFTFNDKYAIGVNSNIKETIKSNTDVKAFINSYKSVFAGFDSKLVNDLIDNAENIEVEKEFENITQDIFKRMEKLKLVDKYEAYELFNNTSNQISGDIEMIQSEGFDCAKIVDPNLVIKKVNNKEEEVQDGWKGHILPFDLVQNELMKDEMMVIKSKRDRMQEIPSEYEEILSSLTEDDKDLASDALSDENDSFVVKNIAKVVKELKKNEADEAKELIRKLEQVEKLSKEEKQLKVELKKDEEELILKTKSKIENLTDSEVKNLLKIKWISPIIDGILELPNNALNILSKAVEELSNKYTDTFEDIEKDINETELTLANMINELTGDETDMLGIKEFQKLLGGGINA